MNSLSCRLGLGLACLIAGSAPLSAAEAAHVATAWFTDATISGAVRGTPPASLPRAAAGSAGIGVRLGREVGIENPVLQRANGMIAFWVRPDWNGGDGKRHPLLHVGDPARNGLLVEKAASGMLRFVMASSEKTVASRADVSAWKAGQWHHIAVSWFSRDGRPIGLPLWIDRVAVDGPVACGCTFLDPEAMPDRRVWIGGEAADADMDELVFRDLDGPDSRMGQVAFVYRDYFATAPYDAVRVDAKPLRVPSDARAVAGYQKQFGLQARREGRWEPVTDHAVRYGQWADFDAKPMIRWTTSDARIATVDKDGRVSAKTPGACRIGAAFRGLRAAYDLAVISADRPDLGIVCVAIRPRYRADAAKDRPAVGEMLTAAVRFGNFGLAPLSPGAVVKFELVPLARTKYTFDPTRRPAWSRSVVLDRGLAVGEETRVEFRFPSPAAPMWMRTRLDPAGEVDEFCEANNEIAERTDARPIQFAYHPKHTTGSHINHVGSLSVHDWLRAQKLRMDIMLREAVWPTTGPQGVDDCHRIDSITELNDGPDDAQPYHQQADYYDGGFPVNEPVDWMAVDSAIIHEFGHTILSQPDLYGYPMTAANVFLRDAAGKAIAGTPALPVVSGETTLAFSHAQNVPCGVGYNSLMDFCHLWLHPSQAGHIQHYRGFRPDRFWGTQGRLIPTRSNALMVTDIDDRPLKGAAIYVYHVVNPPVQDSGAKYIPDRPKFVGQTDAEGRFVFPASTDADWDDADTDEVDGEIPVWNPFGRARTDTAFTPNVWSVEGLLLVAIVAGERTEYRWMDLTEFNEAYLAGDTVRGTYWVRTSLSPSAEPTPVVRHPAPEAIRTVNKRPKAVVKASELTVRCGVEFEIDGSASSDPEGQPLIYRWNMGGEWLRSDLSQGPILRAKAPDSPGALEYRFWVIDGLRCSEPVTIKVTAVK